MNDLISRQAAIDALMEQFKRNPTTAIRAKLTVEGVPSAQLEQQWIPCSEPPTEHGFYHEILLYGKDGNYAVGWYDEDYFTWDDRFDLDTPIAWMPLPEPYKERREE